MYILSYPCHDLRLKRRLQLRWHRLSWVQWLSSHATAPSQNPGTATTQPQSYPGGLPHTTQQTSDPLHHLLAQPSLKRLGLTPIITNYTDICISNMPTQTTSDQDIFTIRHGDPDCTICLAYADLCSGDTAYSTDWIRSSSRHTRSPQLD